MVIKPLIPTLSLIQVLWVFIFITLAYLVNEFKLEEPRSEALISLEKEVKIPFLYNKEFLNKINMENADMLDKINKKNKSKIKTSEYDMYNEMLIKDVATLELFNFNKIVDEVI